MIRRSTLLLLPLLLLAFQAAAAEGPGTAPPPEPKDMKSIFNGKDLAGWDGDPRLWSVRDGAIRGETTAENPAQGNTFLIWKGGVTRDFDLRLSFRCSAANNSGIQYRSKHITEGKVRNPWVVRGYQHEIRNEVKLPSVAGFIYDEGGKRGRMCLVGEKAIWGQDGTKTVSGTLIDQQGYERLFRLDDWNDVVILAKGNRIQHYLNNVLIVDCTDNDPRLALREGILALQLHAGAPMWAEFKNLRIKEIESLRLTLPPAWYGVPGVPLALYYDNVVLTPSPEKYRFEVFCDIGKCESRRWAVTPGDGDVGDHPLRVVVQDSQGKELETAASVLRVVPRNSGQGQSLRLLIVGDSLTAASLYPAEIARLLSQPGNPRWELLGTRKSRQGAAGVLHEGIGGWTWNAFLSRYQPQEKVISPFLFVGQDGKAVLDLPRYFREHCGNQPPDVVTFLLGINDCFGANPEDPQAIDASIDAMFENADALLGAFRAAAPKAALAIGLTPPPNSREEGFQANYKGKYHRWGWKRIQHRLVERQLAKFSNREKEGIYVVPTELNLDPVDGYPNNNGVHPNQLGYDQIGASFYGWLKWWMTCR